jgi:hypothetical protein
VSAADAGRGPTRLPGQGQRLGFAHFDNRQGATIMKQRHIPLIAAAMALALVSGCAVADEGYFMSLHPNIQAADYSALQAIEQMRAAQAANDYHMGGHAAHAIQLLQDARYEMQAAAAVATR